MMHHILLFHYLEKLALQFGYLSIDVANTLNTIEKVCTTQSFKNHSLIPVEVTLNTMDRPVKRDTEVKHSSDNTDMSITSSKKFQLYLCPRCKKYILKQSYNRHVSDVHGPKKYLCDECGSLYSDVSSLRRHKKTNH